MVLSQESDQRWHFAALILAHCEGALGVNMCACESEESQKEVETERERKKRQRDASPREWQCPPLGGSTNCESDDMKL